MNAVFERDFVRFSCSGRFLWLRLIFAVGMGALVLSKVLPGYLSSPEWSNVGISVLVISVGLGAATVLLMAPGAFGTVLVHARAQGSLPVLLSTPLTPLKIAVGAFAARCGLLLLFIVATWPPIMLALLYGGVRTTQMFEASAALVSATLVIGAPAFVVSAFARRTAGAVVASYLLAAGILGALAMAGAQLEATTPWLAGAISPIHAMQQALSAEALDHGMPIAPSLAGLAWTLCVAVLAVLFAAVRLRQEGLGDGDPTVPSGLLPRRHRPLRYENPILDHELRTGMLVGNSQSGSRSLFALLVLTELAYFGAVAMGASETSLNLHFGILAFHCLLLVLGVTAAGATTLATEHETHVLDLMRVTPLSPAQIVIGKLAGLIRTLFPCLIVPLFHLVWASTMVPIFSPLVIVLFPVVGTVALCTWALAGMLQSLEQTDPRRAIMRTMGLIGIFGVIIAAMIGVPIQGVLRGHDEFLSAGMGFGANPVGLMLLPVTACRIDGSTLETANLAGPSSGELGMAVTAGLIWLAVHVVVALMIYRRLFRTYRTRFDW